MTRIERPANKPKRQYSPEQLAELQRRAEHARSAAVASGLAPRQARLNKITAALTLVHRWQFTSPTLLDTHVQGRAGLARDLIRANLLDEHMVPGPGRMFELPASVVTLAPQSVEFIEPTLRDPIAYVAEVPWHQLRHDLAVQRMTLRALDDQKITGYLTPSEIAAKSARGRKQPDAVWLMPDCGRAAFELELTSKKGREFDETCRAIIEALRHDASDGYDLFIIASPSRAILKHYQLALRVGAAIKLWERNAQRQWRLAPQVMKVPDWTAGRMLFKEVSL